MAAAPSDRACHTVAPDPGRVVTKAVLRAAEELGITARALAPVIGVSEATVSRMKNGGFAIAPDTKPFELAVLFVRLFRSLDAIVGGDPQVARAWLSNANEALDGRPIDRIRTITGLFPRREVEFPPGNPYGSQTGCARKAEMTRYQRGGTAAGGGCGAGGVGDA